ncbi:MAG TPA: hypothetical protein PLE45_11410 [Spirochaetota bacterium]|nr:hypothetical protein [Spirochaetota bacterium]
MSEILKEFEAVFEQIEEGYNTKKISKFRYTLKGAANNINNLMEILIRKSLIKEEKYDYLSDEEKERFFLPEEKNFLEVEKPKVLYERLSALVRSINYLADNMPDDIDDFTDEYLENNRKILDYFSFHNYNSPNTGINTRALKELTDRIMNGTDEILKKIVYDNLKLLADSFHSIQLTIEDITKYKKEKYKFKFRYYVFPYLPAELNDKLFQENNQLYLKKIEEFMNSNVFEVSYNRFWINETIKECYFVNEIDVLERVKKNFLTETEKKKTESLVHSPREKLLKLIMSLANTKNVLEELYHGLEYNITLLKNREKSFIEKLQDILRKIFNMASEDDFFHIEYINPTNKAIQKDIININEFLSSIKKKLSLFNEISRPTSSIYQKINRGTEEALYKFMDDTYFSLILMKERIIGIDSELKINIPKKIRLKMRDLSSLLETLNSILTNVGEQRRKFVMEQEAFLKKGIPKKS